MKKASDGHLVMQDGRTSGMTDIECSEVIARETADKQFRDTVSVSWSTKIKIIANYNSCQDSEHEGEASTTIIENIMCHDEIVKI
jgi:hypothetical protein